MQVEKMSYQEYQERKNNPAVTESVEASNSGADNVAVDLSESDGNGNDDGGSNPLSTIEDFFLKKNLSDNDGRLNYLKQLEDSHTRAGEFESKVGEYQKEKETLSTKLQEYELALEEAKKISIKDYFADDDEFIKNAIIKGDKSLKSAVSAFFNGADTERLAIEQIMLEKGVKRNVAERFLNSEYNAFLGDDEDNTENKDMFLDAKAAPLRNKIEQLKAGVSIPEMADPMIKAQEKIAATKQEKETQKKGWLDSKETLMSQFNLSDDAFKVKIENEEIVIPKFEILEEYKSAVFNHMLERNDIPATKENLKLVADRYNADYLFVNFNKLTEHIAREAYLKGKAADRKERANLGGDKIAPNSATNTTTVKSTPRNNNAQSIANKMGW